MDEITVTLTKAEMEIVLMALSYWDGWKGDGSIGIEEYDLITSAQKKIKEAQ